MSQAPVMPFCFWTNDEVNQETKPESREIGEDVFKPQKYAGCGET